MRRWQDYSADPNTADLHARRAEALADARTNILVEDRVEYLCRLAAGKSVLDIGVVDHRTDAASTPTWLHGSLKRHAATCLGVDVLAADIARLRELGYNVVCADLSQSALPQKFDCIVCGEVIEHLDAPGPLMRNCASMLNPGGRLAITTPNPWYANAIAKNCISGAPFVDSADHVAWYDASVLYELGQRHGLRLTRFSGVGSSHPKGLRGKLFFRLRPLLLKLGLNPNLFAKTIIYEFVRDGN